jgi:hypothetical protein
LHATPQGTTKKRFQQRHYVYLGIVVAIAACLAWSLSLLASAAPPGGAATSASVATSAYVVGSGASGDIGVASSVGGKGTSIRLLPPSVGGLALAAQVSGAQARAQVEQLHGKVLGAGLDQAWIGQYGDPPQATVWATRSVRREDAEALLARMAGQLGNGDSPFHVVGPVVKGDAHGYELDGMGQKHYYFLVGSDLYWLAIDPRLGPSGLDELVRFGASMEAL